MDYEKIICEFCKKCKGSEIIEKTIPSTSINGDILLVRCINFSPKYNFEDKEQYKDQYCSLFGTGSKK